MRSLLSTPSAALIPTSLLAALLAGASPALAAQDDAPPAGQEPEDETPSARPRGGAAPSDDAFEMGSPPQLAEGLTEEEMWPAADAEGWAKPCLIPWQRSFEDAMGAARDQRRPVLVCVNMDGEIASEHWAGVRYREPETAAQMSAYICVLASVYRHTPRDYDTEGRRVECPRFGTVTCGEHIENERELYDKYFDGRRISPRHIVLDLEGKETQDVYFAWDTQTIFTTFVKGVEGWPEPIEPKERTLEELCLSPDVEDREAVELAYVEGDVEVRRQILRTLVAHRRVDQVEVLRAALFGFDLELAGLARQALAQCDTEPALDLMAEALKLPLEAEDRELLLAAVERLAQSSPRARTLASLHRGLGGSSRWVDAGASAEDLMRAYEANAARGDDVEERELAAQSRPDDPGTLLELARAFLTRAQETSQPEFAALLYEDAHRAARTAEELGAYGGALETILALTCAERGQWREARGHALAAVESGALELGSDAAVDEERVPLTPAARRVLLQLFGEARQRAIRRAYRAGESWPSEWLSDLSAAYTEVARGPLDDPTPLVEYHDFLRWIGATGRAGAVLTDALARFPDSPELHARLRDRLLWEEGPSGLERAYDERLTRAAESDSAGADQLSWFAGYAFLVAAEQHRRGAEPQAALAAYARSVELYRENIVQHPEGSDTCRHFIALALAGRSRVELALGRRGRAVEALLAAFDERPDSAASPDGLNITPVQTAKMLMARLADAGETEAAERVQARLDALDPVLLEPPPSERFGSGRRARAGRSQLRPADGDGTEGDGDGR